MTAIKTIVVCDIEATCWDGAIPPHERAEIIEIGAAKMSIETLEIIETFQTFVRPVMSRLSPFCTSLTNITWDDVKQAPPLQGAVNNLIKFGSRNCIFATWGYYDCAMFEKMIDAVLLREVPFQWRNVLNVKPMAQVAFGEFSGLGQGQAAKRLGLPANKNAHRADADAYETARILSVLMRTQRTMIEGVK